MRERVLSRPCHATLALPLSPPDLDSSPICDSVASMSSSPLHFPTSDPLMDVDEHQNGANGTPQQNGNDAPLFLQGGTPTPRRTTANGNGTPNGRPAANGFSSSPTKGVVARRALGMTTPRNGGNAQGKLDLLIILPLLIVGSSHVLTSGFSAHFFSG